MARFLALILLLSRSAASLPLDSAFCGCLEASAIPDPTTETAFEFELDHMVERCDQFCAGDSIASHFVLKEMDGFVQCACHHDLNIFDCAEEEGVPLVGVHCKTMMNLHQMKLMDHMEVLSPPPFRTLSRDLDLITINTSSHTPTAQDKALGLMALILGVVCVIVLVVMLTKTWFDHKRKIAKSEQLRKSASIASFAQKIGPATELAMAPSGVRLNSEPSHLVFEKH